MHQPDAFASLEQAKVQRLTPITPHAGVDRLDPDRAAAYVLKMPVRLLRRFFAFLVVGAYLSATILSTMPIASAATVEIGSGMMDQQNGTSDKMPCQGKMAGCVTELGCAFMVSLPAPDLAFSTVVIWSPVTYSGSLDPLRGRTIRPALGPPISRT